MEEFFLVQLPWIAHMFYWIILAAMVVDLATSKPTRWTIGRTFTGEWMLWVTAIAFIIELIQTGFLEDTGFFNLIFNRAHLLASGVLFAFLLEGEKRKPKPGEQIWRNYKSNCKVVFCSLLVTLITIFFI